MKVMIVNSLYYPNIIGGAEKSVQIIAENLLKSGMIPVVITVADRERVDYVNGVKVYYINHSNVYWSYYSKTKRAFLKPFWHLLSLYNFIILKKVREIIRKEKPDIVHTNNLSEFSVGIWKVFKQNKIPVIHTLRDYSLLCPRAILFKRGKNCTKKNFICKSIMIFRRVFSIYVDTVVGNSNFVLNMHLDSGFFANSSKDIIYNSLDSGKITAKQKKSGNLNFGFVGILALHKGIELLLRVFQEIGSENLHVFGNGITHEYEEYLKNKYLSEKITFHGFVSTDEAFKIIDVLIVPSLMHDSFPRVVYESFSFGTPVIGSNRGGITEIIDIGKTGFIFDADSEEQLKDKIFLFKNNPAIIKAMSINCIEKAKDFLPENVIQKYITVYKKVFEH